VLEVDDLCVTYGGLQALCGVSLRVDDGQFVAIVGPNGAGKTTLFKAISGTVPAASGAIRYDGRNLLTVPPAARAHLGIAHVPEGRQPFSSMTVLENLEMGAYAAGRRQTRQPFERVFTLFPVLRERRDQIAGTLSGGEQQMLAIGRALMLRPRLMLLDEPSFGLAPMIVAEVFAILRKLNEDDGMSMLLVEQNATAAINLADQAYLLETGHLVMGGAAADIGRDENVRRAYLGY
jgi:branched-chain amino acid transport system ATP-binding protein